MLLEAGRQIVVQGRCVVIIREAGLLLHPWASLPALPLRGPQVVPGQMKGPVTVNFTYE
jgi:hypothetical protein